MIDHGAVIGKNFNSNNSYEQELPMVTMFVIIMFCDVVYFNLLSIEKKSCYFQSIVFGRLVVFVLF